jgi:hypothetical protein
VIPFFRDLVLKNLVLRPSRRATLSGVTSRARREPW